MSNRASCLLLFSCFLATSLAPQVAVVANAEAPHVLVVVGPSNHPPGTHEVAAGGRLLAHCLKHALVDQPIDATVVYQWPEDMTLLQSVDSVVFLGDQFPPHQFPNSEQIMAELDAMMQRGCGIACIHFTTGLRSPNVPPDGDHPLLRWMGGYFASRCEHHQSLARIFPEATIEPAPKLTHPVMRGWSSFTLHDEPYINNYFGPGGQLLEQGTIAFATSSLPPDDPQQQVVSWGIERQDGGRGFAIVMPHFYRNWALKDLRTLILNGVAWTAKAEIPAQGVQIASLDLNQFEPEQMVWPKPDAYESTLKRYFSHEVARIESANDLTRYETQAEWEAEVETNREALAEMLGLRPEPPRGDLRPMVVGTLEQDGIIVERLHFQSLPGLYVTANLYRPAEQTEPLPGVLYVCGHSNQQETIDGNQISYGNKTGYQRHGGWLARHGYVCLTIDTIQLGEFMGFHHGTYRMGRWDWISKGYTPAGVEAWNGIRALDYMQSRKEIDPNRLAVTGRSGGGAYSWFVAALDKRVKAAVPVAGITDLRNYVVDRCVTGHCDCMFFVNYQQWDYANLAALVAPRALLIANSDRDTIFPLDGVTRVVEQVQHIYSLYGAQENLGTWITSGPHKDTYELQVGAFRWLDHHLKDRDATIAERPIERFDREALKVFADLPQDERVTTADDLFADWLDRASESVAEAEYASIRNQLRELSFARWPRQRTAIRAKKIWHQSQGKSRGELWQFESQPGVILRALVHRPEGATAVDSRFIQVVIADDATWQDAQRRAVAGKWSPKQPWTVVVSPRGFGPLSAARMPEKDVTQWKRTYYLAGQTESAMQALDVERSVQFAQTLRDTVDSIHVVAAPKLHAVSIYAKAVSSSEWSLDGGELPADYLTSAPLLGAARIKGLTQYLNSVAATAQP